MRVATEEWRSFIPGVRMYKNMKTLFYTNAGEHALEMKMQINANQKTIQQIIVLPNVTFIPGYIFNGLMNLKTVILHDHVKRINEFAFEDCHSLVYVKLSRHLKHIGKGAFCGCISLPSIFIPRSCQKICQGAFDCCKRLIIFNVPRHTQLGKNVIQHTPLFQSSPFKSCDDDLQEFNLWIKNINMQEKYALHRLCASWKPSVEEIYQAMKKDGIQIMNQPNELGITPSQYLAANPFSEVDEQKIVSKFILEMMGEIEISNHD
ncbi:hypothetical protein CTEN210_17948 [Chaetoceros tenuissimus]|uniref:Uncharacterized protein n=1 Tax=Chaetoceros tenuissimus TaxID=426638 RepID=A0AAD3HF01_9STRA|nr:hypothetical protein CTEN210_17948 [Chaetoceros tenuissimus]